MATTTLATRPLEEVADLTPSDKPLLAVWAHPDDESFCGAGLMHAAATAGRRVVNVSATSGELGTQDPAAWPPERLGRRRRRELGCALDHLGGGAAEFLGIRDGSCQHLDDRIGARRVATVIANHRPGLILTFGEDGVTGHPDHQAIHRWTIQAAAMVDPSIPVVGAITAHAWPEDLIDPLHEVGAFFPGYPADRVLQAGDLAVQLPAEALTAKLAALAAHDSQIGPIRDRLGADNFARLFAGEAYRPLNEAARSALGRSGRGESGRPMGPTRPMRPVA